MPWYGLGEAELALRSHAFTPTIALNRLRRVLNVDEASKAVADQRRALQNDPGFGPAMLGLAVASILDDDESGMVSTLHTAWAAASTAAARSPDYWLGRGMIEEYLARSDSAVFSYRRYVSSGGDSALGLVHQARAWFDLGQNAEGDSTYYRAARLARSSAAIALLREDLSFVATEVELVGFDSLSSGREAWIRYFWNRRDLEAGRRLGERLAEHYRRYFHAVRHFRRRGGMYWQVDPVFPYRGDQTLFDDRGVIYVRHGEPTATATFVRVDVPPNLSWKYLRPGSSLTFHFRPQGDPRMIGNGNYRLVESLTDISSDPEFLASRGSLDVVYDQLGYLPTDRAAQLERERGFTTVQLGTRTDSYQLQFHRNLPGVAGRYALDDPHGKGTILLVFAAPLKAFAADTGPTHRLDIHATATDESGAYTVLDSTWTVARDSSAGSDRYVVVTFTLPVAPGRHSVTLVATTASGQSGRAQRWEDVVIPDRSMFGLSDIVLGRRESGITWIAGADTIPLNPLNSFPSGSDLRLFYQVFGVAADSTYRTRVTMEPLNGNGQAGGARPIDVTFDERASTSVMSVVRGISLTSARSGDYRITVTVTGPDGRSTSRETRFQVE